MEISKILHRLDSLIEMGDKVLSTVHDGDFVDNELSCQWSTSSAAILKGVFSENSVHYQHFKDRCQHPWRKSDSTSGLATLKAAREDIAGGYLQEVENLVSADIFNDFLEMAEYLLDYGYKDPTASLVGAVLEDGLRRICSNSDITIKSRENISSLNTKLAAKNVYNRLQQRQIQVWNDIRDNADHGNFQEYKEDDVKDMLVGVRKFLTDYLV